jgi:hypothetical protein
MKSKGSWISFLWAFFPIVGQGYDAPGIRFESTTSWAQVLVKASAEHKYILVEFRSGACQICVSENTSIRFNERVAKFFNRNYIALEAEVNSPPNLNGVRLDATALTKFYKITSFPTLLFLTSSGHVVNRVDWVADASFLLDAGAAAIRFDHLAADYKSGRKNTDQSIAFIARTALAIGDQSLARQAALDHISQILVGRTESGLTRDDVGFLADFTQRSSDPGFSLLYFHRRAIDRIMGDRGWDGPYSYTQYYLDKIIADEEVKPAISAMDQSEPKWTSIYEAIQSKYSGIYAERVVGAARIDWYLARARWREWCTTVSSFINSFGDLYPGFVVNNLISDMTDHGCERSDLQIAANWMGAITWSQSDDAPQAYVEMSNYANLLYSMGDPQAGIALKEKSLRYAEASGEAPPDVISGIQRRLGQMRQGISLADPN